MSIPNSLTGKAFSTGNYFLLDLDSVLELYKNAGYNIDNEEEEVPNVLAVDGVECFFTGDLVRRGDKYYEIVIAASGFTWDEVESDLDEDEDDED
jgi:hypothetical protein